MYNLSLKKGYQKKIIFQNEYFSEPKKDKENFENFVKEEVKEDLSDDEYLKKYLLEATMKSVLDKMVIMKTIIHSSEIKIFKLDEMP